MSRKKMVPVGDLFERVHSERKNGMGRNYTLIAKLTDTTVSTVKNWHKTGKIPQEDKELIELWNDRKVIIRRISIEKAHQRREKTWVYAEGCEEKLPLVEACAEAVQEIADLVDEPDEEVTPLWRVKAEFFIDHAFDLPNSGVTVESGTRDVFVNALKEIIINGGN